MKRFTSEEDQKFPKLSFEFDSIIRGEGAAEEHNAYMKSH